MRRAAVLVNPRMSHQGSWAEAFAAGLRRHGWKAEIVTDYQPADLVAMWSVRRQDVIRRARGEGAEIVVCERGYMGGRKTWISLSFGGELNGRAEFRGPFHDCSRFEKHFADLMRPWNPSTEPHAVLMGQVDGDMSTKGVNLRAWYDRTTKALEAQGWRVTFRPHPLCAKAGTVRRYRDAQQAEPGDLAAAFEGAGVVVTFNSNSGVDAALAGKPVIAMDAGSMAAPVAARHVYGCAERFMPDRRAWAARLAWCQYTKDELASGFAWEAVTCRERETSTAA